MKFKNYINEVKVDKEFFEKSLEKVEKYSDFLRKIGIKVIKSNVTENKYNNSSYFIDFIIQYKKIKQKINIEVMKNRDNFFIPNYGYVDNKDMNALKKWIKDSLEKDDKNHVKGSTSIYDKPKKVKFDWE